MEQGIILLAIGKSNYIKFAYNMAMSIRYFSQIPIHLIHDESIEHIFPHQRDIFTSTQEINREDCYYPPDPRGSKIFPAKAKLSLYQYLPYKHNLYLDVDGVLIKPIEPIFDAFKQEYHAQLLGRGKIGENKWDDMIWAYGKDIKKKYRLKDGIMIPFINSSCQYIKKCKKNEYLYKQALQNLRKPIPVDDLRFTWGKNQPDELYMNIALCQREIDPEIPGCRFPVYFSNQKMIPEQQLINEHYVLGLYGDQTHTHNTLLDYYNRRVQFYSKKLTGSNIIFKSHALMRDKFMKKRGK